MSQMTTPDAAGTHDDSAPTTAAKLTVDALRGLGVDTLFCLPGVQNDDFFNALVDAPDIKVITTRHEQGAAYMATGASLVTGGPAACAVVPGPGMLNAAGALTTAYWSNARVLAVVGQIPTDARGRTWGVLHELPDQTAILRQLTKQAALIDSPGAAAKTLQDAIDSVVSGRPRPVSVEVPADLWSAPTTGRVEPSTRYQAISAGGVFRGAASR